MMAILHRGWTSCSTYFITASACDKSHLLQSDRVASLLVEVLYHYHEHEKYLLHEFVVMPNHFHLLITPAESLERSLQLIKGGFSFRAKRELKFEGKIWQSSYYDRRVRDSSEYEKIKRYIRQNPVRARLVENAEDYPFSSANLRWSLDEAPQRLKPLEIQLSEPQR
jgi:putative transposase